MSQKKPVSELSDGWHHPRRRKRFFGGVNERHAMRKITILRQKPFVSRLLKSWWDLQTMPRLEWMQIEVTTRCTAGCFYCPRTTYREDWENRDLSFEHFKAMLPVMSKAKMVHLQGWGEPFLHSHLFDMIALAKKAGCMVGTTTNGMLLDRQRTARLIQSGIDYVAFSLTGLGEKNDFARSGTRFSYILQVLSDLAMQKKALRVEKPVIGVAYLLLRSHLADLGQLVPTLAETGAQQVVVSTLDFFPCGNLRHESLSPGNPSEYRDLKNVFDRLGIEAEKKGLDLFYNLVLPADNGRSCTENPCRALFVSSDGSVSPCVFSHIPVSKSLHTGKENEDEYPKIIFGNLSDTRLPTIWKFREYRAFRKNFGKRPYALCRRCLKRHQGANPSVLGLDG